MVTVLGVVLFRMPLVGTVADPFRPFHPTIKLTFANLLLLQNLLRQPNAEGVLWSLPLEVQMYIVLPALFLLARKEEALWPFLVLWGLAVGVVHGCLPRGTGNNLMTVVPDFLPGILAYVGFRRHPTTLPTWLFPVLLAALCVGFVLRPSMPVGWILCLLLGLALPHFRQSGNRKINLSSHTIAKYSYGIYLLHPWSILLAFHVLRGRPLALQLAVEMVSLAVLAVTAYHLILQRRYDQRSHAEEPGLELA